MAITDFYIWSPPQPATSVIGGFIQLAVEIRNMEWPIPHSLYGELWLFDGSSMTLLKSQTSSQELFILSQQITMPNSSTVQILLYAEVDGVSDNTFMFSITIRPASLTITNPNLETGQVLNFTFAGFNPYGDHTVEVGVVGGGANLFNTDGEGNGGGAFAIGEPAGDYTLLASDADHFASAPFTVTGVVGVWQLLNTVNATAVMTGNLLGWVLLNTVDTQVTRKTVTPPPPDGENSWLMPALIVGGAIVAGAVMANESRIATGTKKK